MSKSNIPNKIEIGSLEWKIDWNADLRSNVLGVCDSKIFTIKISKKSPTVKIKKSTLLHEILHAIYFTYGFTPCQKDSHDHEEEVVSFLSSALFDVLSQNPALHYYIFSDTLPKDGA